MLNVIKSVVLPLNIAEHVVDNYLFDKVEPIVGSVLYVDFIASLSVIQHSGIYIGNNEIVHLNGDGLVEIVSPEEFIGGWGGLKCGSSIYVSCNGTTPVGDLSVANNAKQEVGTKYNYKIYKFNCHHFVVNSLTGFSTSEDDIQGFEYMMSTLTGLKLLARDCINSNNWRVWDRSISIEKETNEADMEGNNEYSSQYNEDGFWSKIKNYAKAAGETVLEPALKLYYSAEDSDTPKWAKATVYGALGYFISPIDAIPDITPVVGYTDDLGVLVAATASIAAHIKEEHVNKAKETLKKWLG